MNVCFVAASTLQTVVEVLKGIYQGSLRPRPEQWALRGDGKVLAVSVSDTGKVATEVVGQVSDGRATTQFGRGSNSPWVMCPCGAIKGEGVTCPACLGNPPWVDSIVPRFKL